MLHAATCAEPVTIAAFSEDFSRLPLEQLKCMSRAADRLLDVLESTAKKGGHIVRDLIGDAVLTVGDHYPSDDVYDPMTGTLFFYHAHDAGTRAFAEHGHFHCFVERHAIPPGLKPLKRPGRPKKDWGLCHLVAVSMDSSGVPARLFTTNQWVTKEWLYPAPVVIDLLERFAIADASLVTPAGEWITSLIALFRPQIEFLLHARDRTLAAHRQEPSFKTVYQDETLEIASLIEIDIDRQIVAVNRALA